MTGPASGTARVPSMASRLAWRLGVLFVVAFLIAGLVPYINSRDDRTEIAAETLQADMHILAKAIVQEPDGRIAVGLPPTPHFAYRIRDAAGIVLAVSPGWETASMRATTPGPHGEMKVGTLTGAIAMPQGPLLLDVALVEAQPTLLQSLVNEWGDEVLPLLLPVLAAALIVGIFTIRRSLVPLNRLAREAQAITPRDTGVRLSTGDLPAELMPLVTAVNAALDRLAEGFRHQREFTADAAHELRTPLAVLSAHVETLPDKTVATSLKEDLAGMRRLVDQMLAVAELEAKPLHTEDELDLAALAVELAAALAPLALAQRRSLAVIGAEQPVRIHGDAAALRRGLRNLVENAIAHTPEGTTVDIEVVTPAGGRGPAVRVRDRGPGFGPSERARVTQRFFRGRRAKGAGAGLGLAIVDRILKAHGGRLEIADAADGGAVVSLRLPPL
jgi:signal transduction histidine kinase